MAHRKESDFGEWEFTVVEELQCRIFNDLQLAGLQNDLAVIQRERFAIQIDIANPLKYVKDIATLEGKSFILMGLITAHYQAKVLLHEAAIDASQS